MSQFFSNAGTSSRSCLSRPTKLKVSPQKILIGRCNKTCPSSIALASTASAVDEKETTTRVKDLSGIHVCTGAIELTVSLNVAKTR